MDLLIKIIITLIFLLPFIVYLMTVYSIHFKKFYWTQWVFWYLWLFNVRSALSYPLIFRYSIHLRVFHNMLKMNFVTSVFKSEIKSDVKKYRQISILNNIVKLFELIILLAYYVLWNILPLVNNILIDEQYDTRPGRSAVSNLIVFTVY